MKKVAIVQSNYIPWKGYFDLIAAVDEFVLYDDMQYTRRDWRNRNLIKTAAGLQWLTIPVKVKGKYLQKINETETDGQAWRAQHWRTISHNYRKAPHFEEISAWLEPLYLAHDDVLLSDVNRRFIRAICDYLNIPTQISQSSDYVLQEGKSERLAELCKQAGAAEYVSGPSAKTYLDEQVFEQFGLRVTWFEYSGYSEYKQLWTGFEHGVSMVDLLFNCGTNAKSYMRKVGR